MMSARRNNEVQRPISASRPTSDSSSPRKWSLECRDVTLDSQKRFDSMLADEKSSLLIVWPRVLDSRIQSYLT